MRLLIIEDKVEKFNITYNYIKNVDDKIECVRATNLVEAKRFIKNTNHCFDGIVIDMMFPVSGMSIKMTAGIDFLQYLDYIENKVPRVINTSGEETRDILKDNNYPNEVVIINSSMYNCYNQFKEFIDRVKQYKLLKESISPTDVKHTMLESIVTE